MAGTGATIRTTPQAIVQQSDNAVAGTANVTPLTKGQTDYINALATSGNTTASQYIATIYGQETDGAAAAVPEQVYENGVASLLGGTQVAVPNTGIDENVASVGVNADAGGKNPNIPVSGLFTALGNPVGAGSPNASGTVNGGTVTSGTVLGDTVGQNLQGILPTTGPPPAPANSGTGADPVISGLIGGLDGGGSGGGSGSAPALPEYPAAPVIPGTSSGAATASPWLVLVILVLGGLGYLWWHKHLAKEQGKAAGQAEAAASHHAD